MLQPSPSPLPEGEGLSSLSLWERVGVRVSGASVKYAPNPARST
jgi:hypothetical protein